MLDTTGTKDSRATLRAAIGNANRLLDGVRESQFTDPTPCTDWDVRAVINHIVATATTFAVAAEHGHVPDEAAAALAGDVLGEDFRASWRAAGEQLIGAFDRPGVLDTTLTLPFGVVPGRAALDMATMEVGIHSADLARATHQPVSDQRTFAAVLDLIRANMTDDWRSPGILGPEQPAAPDADAVDRLLAYAGRKA